MRRHALRDDQWQKIEPHLPGREGHVGATAKDNPGSKQVCVEGVK